MLYREEENKIIWEEVREGQVTDKNRIQRPKITLKIKIFLIFNIEGRISLSYILYLINQFR